ncbi:MAG: periplasmic heavy metal sensor [Desulfomonile tiedjei]|nr:periplasmic heavy metal sensor [Desulfomonile tiedjei]
MKFNKVTVLAASLLVLLLASVLYAGPGGWGGGPGAMGRGGAFWGDLSKEQQEKVTSLRLESLKKQEALREQMAKKRIELMEMTSKDKADEGAIQKTREEIWALQDQMRNEGRAMSTKLRSVLTPEQKEKFGNFGPGAGCGFGGGRGFGGCCGGGQAGFGGGRGPGGCCGGPQGGSTNL